MATTRFARYSFKSRKKELICSGQLRTRTGQYYDSKWARVPLAGSTADDLKSAMAAGIEKLNEE